MKRINLNRDVYIKPTEKGYERIVDNVNTSRIYMDDIDLTTVEKEKVKADSSGFRRFQLHQAFNIFGPDLGVATMNGPCESFIYFDDEDVDDVDSIEGDINE